MLPSKPAGSVGHIPSFLGHSLQDKHSCSCYSHRLEKNVPVTRFLKAFFFPQYLYLHPGIATNFSCWKGKSWAFTLIEKDDIPRGDRQEEC